MALSPASSHGGLLPVRGSGSSEVGDVVGVVYNSPTIDVVGGASKDAALNGPGAVLTDAYSQWNGNGYAVSWNGSGVDGDQFFNLFLGGGTSVFNANGTFTSAKGIHFPTADPHILGAWWDNAGTLTKSLG